jgi:hypothetical protein
MNTTAPAPEFTVERATVPAYGKGGRGNKSPLRLQIEALKPGEVLRWRPDASISNSKLDTAITQIRKHLPGKTYATRKVNGGFDIFCVEDMAQQ